MIVLEFRALVNVAASSVVGIEPESSFASASVTTPHIQAHVLTESRCLLALIDILEEIAITFRDDNILGYYLCKLYDVTYLADSGGSSNIFEALRTKALVGANGVLAAVVRSADVTAINTTLVDVNAVVVRSGRVTGRTDAMISTLPILAGLALAALMRPLLTLVYVDAVLSGRGVQCVTGPADHSRCASVKFFHI